MLDADDLLRTLLLRAERAKVRASERAVQQSFVSNESPYWQLGLDARDRFHERMRAAADHGAVALTWARQGGDDRPLEVVRVADKALLAKFLDAATVDDTIAHARSILAPWLTNPRVIELLDAWASMRKVRGLEPDAAPDFANALRVLDALRSISGGEDQIVRSLSATLFADSKRLEALDRHLDVLTADTIGGLARHREEVFGLLGLIKEPQPFLTAGSGRLTLISEECPIVWPYVGVANNQVTGYVGRPKWVLTIENLTAFHVASQRPEARAGLIVYTGGMPSPSWCRAFARILHGLPETIPCYHWGDIDQGGYRIAAHVKTHCVGSRSFSPWLMDASALGCATRSEVPGGLPCKALAPSNVINAMARAAASAGWTDLAARMPPVCIEQESLLACLPS